MILILILTVCKKRKLPSDSPVFTHSGSSGSGSSGVTGLSTGSVGSLGSTTSLRTGLSLRREATSVSEKSASIL